MQEFDCKQYNTIKFNSIKFKIGQNINVYREINIDKSVSAVLDQNMWFAKVVGIFSHEVLRECIQILVKVQWYHIEKYGVQNKPNIYYLTDTYDFITPASIKSHCMVISCDLITKLGLPNTESNNDSQYFICSLFANYYSKFI